MTGRIMFCVRVAFVCAAVSLVLVGCVFVQHANTMNISTKTTLQVD